MANKAHVFPLVMSQVRSLGYVRYVRQQKYVLDLELTFI